MPTDPAEAIRESLSSAKSPLTVREIADDSGLAPHEVAEFVWSAPEQFSWQPGGRWTLAALKAITLPLESAGPDDARLAVLEPQHRVELRAIVLDSGTVLRVVGSPLDSPALLTVRTAGSDIELILNSAHAAFEQLPLPFQTEEGDYKGLVELLLLAWAAHEGECPPSGRRGLEDARFFWGRKVLDLLDAEA